MASYEFRDDMPKATGRILALTAGMEFESFFEPGQAPRLNMVFGSFTAPGVRTTKGAELIILPNDMADQEIDSAATLFLHLLMLGHEIAHVVHKHLLGAADQDPEDYLALETWADFYGAKVAMALATHGPFVRRLTASFYPGTKNQFSCLFDVSAALGLLTGTYYTASSRYPSKLVRVGLAYNGIMSFLRHHLAASFTPDLFEPVFRMVYSDDRLRELVLLEGASVVVDEDAISRSARWHRNAQGPDLALTPGFRPEFEACLHTTFDQTEEEISASREVRIRELRAAGFDI